MISAQRPNQYQLSIAQQFVEHFPYVILSFSFLIRMQRRTFVGYRTVWDLFSTESNHEK